MDAMIKPLPTLRASIDEIHNSDVSPIFGSAPGKPTRAEAEAAVTTLLRWIGEDPLREGLVDTPKRVIKAYEELFAGYSADPDDLLNTVFEEVEGYSDSILVKDISFFSHCEHHMVPIIGKAHIAYYPTRGVIGLSKLARVVEVFARRLQTQEALTAQIFDTIEKAIQPRGLAIMIEAEHMCMAMRGVQKQGATTITSRFSGLFDGNAAEQARFLTLIRS